MIAGSGWTIIAKQGNDRYLVDVGEEKARVLDTVQRILFGPWHRESIIARGYWERYDAKPGELDDLLAEVTDAVSA